MSAQFMHDGAQSIICIGAHSAGLLAGGTGVHAGLHHGAMSIAGMPSIDIMSSDIAFIIIASIAAHLLVGAGHAERPAGMHIACVWPRYRAGPCGDRLT
jgi:hypothetical protein